MGAVDIDPAAICDHWCIEVEPAVLVAIAVHGQVGAGLLAQGVIAALVLADGVAGAVLAGLEDRRSVHIERVLQVEEARIGGTGPGIKGPVIRGFIPVGDRHPVVETVGHGIARADADNVQIEGPGSLKYPVAPCGHGGVYGLACGSVLGLFSRRN